jgi:hypothetical protein
MKKPLIISIGAIVIIGFIVLVYWLLNSAPPATSPAANQNIGLPSAGQNATATSSLTQAGVQTLNFVNDPTTVKDPINPGYYYLGYHVNEGISDPTATDNPPYIITYISATHYFNITLLQEPIGTVREEMQQYLMMRLGISQDGMCRLDYMVSVPWRVNQVYSGKNLGFSFCPGATKLPK